MVVLIVVSTATVVILNAALRSVRESTDRVQAADIARSQVDAMRALGATSIPLGLTYGGPSGTDTRFTVATTAAWVGLGQQTTACEAAQPGQAYVRVHVEVTSASLSAPQVLDTVVAPEGTTTVAGTGSVALSVIDQIGQPVSDVQVRATDAVHSANAFTQVTGADGCVFVPNRVPSASLAITISRGGYVSSTLTGASQTLTVSSGAVTRWTFDYAAASSISFASSDSGFPFPATTPATWVRNALGATAQKTTVASTATSLWPATTGFTAWAGRCTDSDPQAYSAARSAFAFTPGLTTVAMLPGQQLIVRGLAAGSAVTAVYAGSDSSCTGLTLALDPTDAQGRTKATLPYGSWQLSSSGVTLAPAAYRPVAGGAAPDPVTVNFGLASLDSPTATPSGPGSPSATSTASPTPTPTSTPSPTSTSTP